MHDTLITAAQLRDWSGPTLVLLDCRFDLVDTAAGAAAYAQGHLPGAHYAHLDRDLSAPRTPGSGRHPLPTREAFAATVARWGITPASQVVAYDAHGGTYAARAWWMLRWLGHRAVAVLDGGLPAWRIAGGALTAQVPAPAEGAAPYPLSPQPGMPTIDAATLFARLGRVTLLDARSPDRFRGENETLDPVAGHIPGAVHRFFRDNLDAGEVFCAPQELRSEFERLGAPPPQVVHSCGSGVTACHNLLAMEVAGLAGSVLYPGSWSEWCADPARPVARG